MDRDNEVEVLRYLWEIQSPANHKSSMLTSSPLRAAPSYLCQTPGMAGIPQKYVPTTVACRSAACRSSRIYARAWCCALSSIPKVVVYLLSALLCPSVFPSLAEDILASLTQGTTWPGNSVLENGTSRSSRICGVPVSSQFMSPNPEARSRMTIGLQWTMLCMDSRLSIV